MDMEVAQKRLKCETELRTRVHQAALWWRDSRLAYVCVCANHETKGNRFCFHTQLDNVEKICNEVVKFLFAYRMYVCNSCWYAQIQTDVSLTVH